MRVATIDLKEKYSFLQGGTLECMLMDFPWDGENTFGWKRPAVIVVPGGGYGMVSRREAFPVASEFFAKGFQAFVLTYEVAPNAAYPEQLLEEAAAVDYVKKHAKQLHINPDEVFLVGFSAGGHLVGNLAVEHQNVSEKAGVKLDCKPTAVGLSYPVISKKNGHQGSYQNLLNGYSEEAQEELLKTLNLDEAVSEQTPPAFLWATATDNSVPADNALRYALALARQEILYEIHVYPEGVHGLSTCRFNVNNPLNISDEVLRASRWVEDCACFFHRFTKSKF